MAWNSSMNIMLYEYTKKLKEEDAIWLRKSNIEESIN
jgi:hypothetical protein